MQTQAGTPDNSGELGRARTRLWAIVEDGLRHGYFECTVSSEVINGKKRRLVIKAGKSDQFTIAEDELHGR